MRISCTTTAITIYARGINVGRRRTIRALLHWSHAILAMRISLNAPFIMAVARKDTDEMVGEIVVMPSEGTISLGYTFSYKHHRQGYAFESLTALIDMLHERYPECEFICFTEPENVPSMALLRKLGFMDMGYLPSKESQVFGKWVTEQTRSEIAMATGRTMA